MKMSQLKQAFIKKQENHEELCDRFDELLDDHAEEHTICRMAIHWIKMYRKDEGVMKSLLIHLCKIQDHVPRILAHEMTVGCQLDCPMKQLSEELNQLAREPWENFLDHTDDEASTFDKLATVNNN